ncbi:fungal pheromone STE3G-protein-coupled receptor [Infundibulicybe gibba]|nr:fungal pheromone STE3G-protein-coupled receptor [Infundibulicybe gibba]
MADPTYPLFSIFAFMGFLLSIIPLPWHLQAWNSGTCFYMMWASLACLNQFINSIVWAGNTLNVAPIWCEISIRIMMGASVGLPAASLCINRRLYIIANVRAVSITRAEKSRAVLVDALICVLFPLIYIALQYVVQGHRFDIYEDIGCFPALYNTLPTYFLSSMWPIIIGLISAVYCVLSLRSFARRRIEFSHFMTSNKSLTLSRYFRLMALAMTEILFTTPLAAFSIWLNATATPIGPWRSWADTHFNYSRVRLIPAILWRSNRLLSASMEFSRWVVPLCALIFFVFFGFADEARRHYRLAFWAVVKRLGFKPAPKPSHAGVPSIGYVISSVLRNIPFILFSSPVTMVRPRNLFPHHPHTNKWLHRNHPLRYLQQTQVKNRL